MSMQQCFIAQNCEIFQCQFANSFGILQKDKIIGINYQTLNKYPVEIESKAEGTYPVAISNNSSNGKFLAIGYNDGSVYLYNIEKRKEECIICPPQPIDDEFQKKIEKITFTIKNGEYLLVRDSQNTLHKYMIMENLKTINDANVYKVSKEVDFSLFKNEGFNFNEDMKKGERSSSSNRDIKLLRKLTVFLDYQNWLAKVEDVYERQQDIKTQPITICKVPGRNLLISLDNDSIVRVWNVFGESCTHQIKDHLPKTSRKSFTPITIFYWDYLSVFIAVYSQTIIFIQDSSKFNIIGHLNLNTPQKIAQCNSFATILYISTTKNQQFAYQFIGQRLSIQATRTFPCIFKLFYPQNAEIILYPGVSKKQLPFFPKIFLNHAFERQLNLYNPILFWYKVRYYNGISSQNIHKYQGYQNILFHYRHFNLLHLYAFHNQSQLLSRALCNGGGSLLIDNQGLSPLAISLRRKAIKCTQVIFNHFSTKNIRHPYFNEHIVVQDCFFDLPSLEYSDVVSVFLNLDVDAQKVFPQKQLPSFVNMRGKTEVVMGIDNEEIQDVVSKQIQQDTTDDLVRYRISKIEFEMKFGAKDSIKTLEKMCETQHVSMLNSPAIQQYIRYKWRTGRVFFMIEGLNFFFYLFFVSIHVIRFRDDPWNVVMMIILSCLQLAQELWQLVGQGRKYLKDPWNWFDLLGIIFIWVYGILFSSSQSEEARLFILALLTSQIWWKAFSYTRLSKSNRFFIRTISRTFIDLKSYFQFMVIYTVAFGVIYTATKYQNELETRKRTFMQQLFLMYKFDLGKHDPSGEYLQNIIYVPATILVTIILFNLLIAIVRDSYLKMKEFRLAQDYRQVVQMLLDYETMAIWNYKKSEKKYILVCQDTEKEFGVDGLGIYRGDDTIDLNSYIKANSHSQGASGGNNGGSSNMNFDEQGLKLIDKMVRRQDELHQKIDKLEKNTAQKYDEMAKLVTAQNDEMKKLMNKSSKVENYGFDALRHSISRKISVRSIKFN